jgi:hypothetical protein
MCAAQDGVQWGAQAYLQMPRPWQGQLHSLVTDHRALGGYHVGHGSCWSGAAGTALVWLRREASTPRPDASRALVTLGDRGGCSW